MLGLMKSTTLVVAVVLAAGVACGPSAKDVKTARSATYSCSYEDVFKAVFEQMKTQGSIAAANPEKQVIASEFRWHTANGVPHKRGAAVVGSGDLAFAVTVVIDGSQNFRLVARPTVLAHVVGSPQGRELSPRDGDWPDWAESKVDVLLVDIHKRLGHCANTGD